MEAIKKIFGETLDHIINYITCDGEEELDMAHLTRSIQEIRIARTPHTICVWWQDPSDPVNGGAEDFIVVYNIHGVQLPRLANQEEINLFN